MQEGLNQPLSQNSNTADPYFGRFGAFARCCPNLFMSLPSDTVRDEPQLAIQLKQEENVVYQLMPGQGVFKLESLEGGVNKCPSSVGRFLSEA